VHVGKEKALRSLKYCSNVCRQRLRNITFKNNKQDARFFSFMVSFSYIIFDMFRTTKCSSSGSL
jgi:hypothetical protein